MTNCHFILGVRYCLIIYYVILLYFIIQEIFFLKKIKLKREKYIAFKDGSNPIWSGKDPFNEF